MFKFTVSGTGDAYPVEYLYAYLAENVWCLLFLNIGCVNNKWWNQNLENSCVLYMVRKCLCDGNDDDNDNGDDDGVKISFYIIFKGILIYIQITKFQECFKKAFSYKLTCRKLLLVAHV